MKKKLQMISQFINSYQDKMQSQQQQTIIKLADRKYNKNENKLDLYGQKLYWSQILLVRDWSMVKQLILSFCGITDETITVLTNLNWPSLTDLDLYENKLSIQGIKELTNKQWPMLHSLFLGCQNMRDEGLSILLRKFSAQLVDMGLGICGITGKDMKLMVDFCPILLRQLYLNRNLIGNCGIKFLVKANLPFLNTLQIIECGIGSQGIKYLTKAQWPNLSSIFLGFQISYENGNTVNLNGWQMMQQNKLKQLKLLYAPEKQSICWLNCILLQTLKIKSKIEISNDELAKSIKQILKTRNLLKN